MGEWKSLKIASGTGWKEIEREAGSGWKALDWESAYEDFTTFTEVDVGANKIQVAANHIDHYAERDETTYVYKDYGVDHFTDFTHKIKVRSDYHENSCMSAAYLISPDLGGWRALGYNDKTLVVVMFFRAGSTLYQGIREEHNGAIYDVPYYWSLLAANTWYYHKIVKSGTSLTWNIYSDSAYSNLLCTRSLTLHADHNFRYLYASSSYDTGTAAQAQNLDIENFDLG